MAAAGIPGAASALASLLAIFLFLAAAAFVLRRFRARLPGGGAKMLGGINIIANRPLGGQHVLVVAEAGGEKFLIGVSRDGMTTIAKLGAHD